MSKFRISFGGCRISKFCTPRTKSEIRKFCTLRTKSEIHKFCTPRTKSKILMFFPAIFLHFSVEPSDPHQLFRTGEGAVFQDTTPEKNAHRFYLIAFAPPGARSPRTIQAAISVADNPRCSVLMSKLLTYMMISM